MANSTEQIVWVVDDIKAVRDSTCAILETYGVRTRGCASAAEFLAQFGGGSTGCLVVDLHMPKMNGIELLELLRARGDRLAVIVVTGRGDDYMAERAMRAGALAMLHKPFDEGALIALITAAISSNA